MTGSDGTNLDVGVKSFNLVKTNDGAAHPFERVTGGDGLPTVVTQIDERTGAVIGQLVTYEPQQLAGDARL